MPRRHLPSPALVVAVIALVLAVGGTSYAVSALPKNSVGTKQLKSHAVTTPKLASSASARIAGLSYKKVTVSVPAGAAGAVSVNCDKGLVAIGGGMETPHTDSAYILDSHPMGGGWQIGVGNPTAVAQSVNFYGVCAKAAPGTPKTSAATASVAQLRDFAP